MNNFKQNGLAFPFKMNHRMMKELEDYLDLEDITKNKGIGDPITIDMHLNRDWDIQQRMMANICDMDILKLIANTLGSKPKYLSLLGTDIFCKKRVSDEDTYTRSFVGWHQDQSWWKLKPAYALVNLWISFDDITEEMGAVKFVINDGEEYITNTQIFEHDQDIKNNDLKYSINLNETKYEEMGKIISVELNKYEAMIFSGLIIHGSLPNKTDKRRCGIVFRFTFKPIDTTIKNNTYRKLRGGVPYFITPLDVIERCKALNLLSDIKHEL